MNHPFYQSQMKKDKKKNEKNVLTGTPDKPNWLNCQARSGEIRSLGRRYQGLSSPSNKVSRSSPSCKDVAGD